MQTLFFFHGPGGGNKLSLKTGANVPPASSSFICNCRTFWYWLSPEYHSQLTQIVERRGDFSWNSVPNLCPVCNLHLYCLLLWAAYSSISLFSSWCSFAVPLLKFAHSGSWWCNSGTWFIYVFCCLSGFFPFPCVCQAVLSHCHVDFVCRCFSRRFSSTYLRRPQALMSTNGWSSKPSLEYAQVCVHSYQL